MAKGPDETKDGSVQDPALARIQARVRRLMMIAIGTLGVGLLAVFVAIGFRVVRSGADLPPAGGPWQSVIEIVTKGDVVATDLDGDRIALTIVGPEGRVVEIHHLASGKLIGRAVLLSK